MSRIRPSWRASLAQAVFGLALLGVAGAARGDTPLTGDAKKAGEARDLTLELSSEQASLALKDSDSGDPLLAIERARAELYQGNCSVAAAILSRPDLSQSDLAASLGSVARGCERSTAGAVIHEEDGVWIRFQDDADLALAPFLVDVGKHARELFVKDLGVTMPTPIRVEIVRDQMALSALTGLPLSAARTTGTIGIAKWGRVVIVSPRATPKGYAFMDTLAHELTHLALTRGSRDRAPLWLQEGVARTEETRWRTPLPFDDLPSADDVAFFGQKNNVGPDIDKIGPSIALLPSAVEAQVTYAKVQSFMKFYADHAGDGAMQKLLAALRDVGDPDQVDAVIADVSGTPFTTWSERWKSHLAEHGKELPDELRPGAPPPKELKDVRKRVRLGELLLGRDHADAAAVELARGHEALPREALVRALYARALSKSGKDEEARKLLEKPEDVYSNDPVWWSMRGKLGIGDRDAAHRTAISRGPYDPLIACGELEPPAVPDDAILAALCRAARDKPRGD